MKLSQFLFERYHKTIITAGTVIVTGIIYILFFSSPAKNWFALNSQLETAREELLDMEEALYQREQIEALCKKFEEQILVTGTDAEELGFVLKELESITRSQKVQVKTIRPLPSQWIGNYRKFIIMLEVQSRVQSL